jgi:hypothetical protein
MGQTFVPFPTGYCSHAPGLRLRAVEELDACVAFLPGQARLFRLNLHAWLILELSRGASTEAVRRAYLDEMASRMSPLAAEASLAAGLEILVGNGLLRIEAAENIVEDSRNGA